MEKIPTRTSWAKITWHRKKKRNKEKKIKIKAKIIKWFILLLLKLKDTKLFS